jgi:hypothetical protein
MHGLKSIFHQILQPGLQPARIVAGLHSKLVYRVIFLIINLSETGNQEQPFPVPHSQPEKPHVAGGGAVMLKSLD